nr:hypothetical protein [uncultured Dyadobacter sp.]
MNRYLLLLLTILALTDCKDKKDPGPLPELQELVGKWRLVGYEHVNGDTVMKESVRKENSQLVQFRYDGILLNELGQSSCCSPSSYLLNGQVFDIKTIGAAPPTSQQCYLVLCGTCPQWQLTLQGDSLAVQVCTDSKMMYLREN